MEGIDNKKKAVIAVAVAGLMIIGGLLFMFSKEKDRVVEGDTAYIDDLIHSTSERTGARPDIVVASTGNPLFSLIGTPAATYYEGKSKVSAPMLLAGENEDTVDDSVSSAVTRFLDAYPDTKGCLIGSIPGDVESRLGASGFDSSMSYPGTCPVLVSIAAARAFWSRSDGAILIEESREGYIQGVPAATLASYLNIPVIIHNGDLGQIGSVLDYLDVKYTIVAGADPGYGKVFHVESAEKVNQALALGMESREGGTLSIMSDRLSITPNYIAVTNPMDSFKPKVMESFTERFSGEVKSTEAGSTSDPSLNEDVVVHHIEIPEDYQYTNVKVSAFLDFTDSISPFRDPEDDGQRGYIYFGFDSDQDGSILDDPDSEADRLEFMVPTLAYGYVREGEDAVAGWAYGEEPVFNAQGTHAIELLATLAYDPLGREQVTSYSIEVTVEKLDSCNYPLMHQASSMAPYLAVNRGGLVLSNTSYSIYQNEEYMEQPFCGDPSQDSGAYAEGDRGSVAGLLALSNQAAQGIKNDINALLANLSGMEGTDLTSLAGEYNSRLGSDPFHVAFVGDTNMVPQYYYPSRGQTMAEAQQGYGVAGDLFYSSIDADPGSPPDDLGGAAASADLSVGRVDGWDAQDISALVCRSVFYEDIVDSFTGLQGQDWKDSAMNMFGSQIPVGTSVTVVEKITEAEERIGFTVDHKHYSPLSDSRLTRDFFERSNFIYFCAHGFWYWFVPPGYKPTAVGGSFNTANVYDMNFGPSILWASSCVTGKIDGIQPYNALSLSFLHSGMNAYIGASRLSWGAVAIIPDMQSGEVFGSYLGLMFYGHLTGYMYDKSGGLVFESDGDYTVGQAFAMAKNGYVENEGYGDGDARADTIEEFNLHGDPAFNPYEPRHSG